MQHHVSSDQPKQYNLILISLMTFRLEYINRFPEIQREYHLDVQHFEPLYDWIVTEAMNRSLHVMCGARVAHHYTHDVYRCIYYELGPIAEGYILQQIVFQQLQFTSSDLIKVMVTAGSVILAKGS